MSLSFDPLSNEEFSWPRNQKVVISFDLEDKVSWAVDLKNDSLVFDFDQIKSEVWQNLTIYGSVIGFNQLKVK